MAGIYFYRQTHDPERLISQAAKFACRGDFQNAEKYYRLAEKTLVPQNDYQIERLAELYLDLGNLYTDFKDSKTARPEYEKAEKLLAKIHSPMHIVANVNLAATYLSTEDYVRAIHYYLAALDEIKQRNAVSNFSNTSLNDIYGNLALCFLHHGEFSQAIIFFHKSLELITKFQPPALELEARTDYHLACAYREANSLTAAETYYLRALNLSDSGSEKLRFRAVNYWGLFKVFQQQNKISEAIKYGQLASDSYRRCSVSDSKSKEIEGWLRKQRLSR